MESPFQTRQNDRQIFAGEEILECFKDSISIFEHDLLQAVKVFRSTLNKSLEQFFLNKETSNFNSSEFNSSDNHMILKQTTEQAVDLRHETNVKQPAASTNSINLHPGDMLCSSLTTDQKSINDDQPSKETLSPEDIIDNKCAQFQQEHKKAVKLQTLERVSFVHPSSTPVSTTTCRMEAPTTSTCTTSTSNAFKTQDSEQRVTKTSSTGNLLNEVKPSATGNLSRAFPNIQITKPSSEEILNDIAQPSSTDISIVITQPSSTEIPNEITQPFLPAIRNDIAQPSSAEIQNDIAQPSSTEIANDIAQPTSTDISIVITQPSSTEIQNEITQMSPPEIQNEITQHFLPEIRSDIAQPPTEIRNDTAQPPSTEISNDTSQPSTEIRNDIAQHSSTKILNDTAQQSSINISNDIGQQSSKGIPDDKAPQSSPEISTNFAKQFPTVISKVITPPASPEFSTHFSKPSSSKISTCKTHQQLLGMSEAHSTHGNIGDNSNSSQECGANSFSPVVLRKNKGRQHKSLQLLPRSFIVKTTLLNFAPGTIKTMKDGTLCLCQNTKRYQASSVVPYLCLIYPSGEVENLRLEGEVQDIAVHPDTDQLYCIMWKNQENSFSNIDIETGKTTKMFDTDGISISFAQKQSSTDVLVLIGCSKNAIHVYTFDGVKLQTVRCSIQPQHLCVCKYTGKIAISAGRDGVQILDPNFEELYRYQHFNHLYETNCAQYMFFVICSMYSLQGCTCSFDFNSVNNFYAS